MYQKGDFMEARKYYRAAIDNLKTNMPDELLHQADSKMMQVYAAEMAQNKFLLACRHFQMGMAVFAYIKEQNPIRELLEDKTTLHDEYTKNSAQETRMI